MTNSSPEDIIKLMFETGIIPVGQAMAELETYIRGGYAQFSFLRGEPKANRTMWMQAYGAALRDKHEWLKLNQKL